MAHIVVVFVSVVVVVVVVVNAIIVGLGKLVLFTNGRIVPFNFKLID